MKKWWYEKLDGFDRRMLTFLLICLCVAAFGFGMIAYSEKQNIQFLMRKPDTSLWLKECLKARSMYDCAKDGAVYFKE